MKRIIEGVLQCICRLSGNQPTMIGLTDVEEEGTFRRINNAPLYYSGWNTEGGEPNGETRENHVGISETTNKWTDYNPGRLGFALCSITDESFKCFHDKHFCKIHGRFDTCKGELPFSGFVVSLF